MGLSSTSRRGIARWIRIRLCRFARICIRGRRRSEVGGGEWLWFARMGRSNAAPLLVEGDGSAAFGVVVGQGEGQEEHEDGGDGDDPVGVDVGEGGGLGLQALVE